jgi:hypothetical protein
MSAGGAKGRRAEVDASGPAAAEALPPPSTAKVIEAAPLTKRKHGLPAA